MKISKVVFTDLNREEGRRYLATCGIVLEDCIRLSDIRLYKGTHDDYYLVMPSKQDVYQSVEKLNPDLDIKYPGVVNPSVDSGKNKSYQEYFFPVDRGFYGAMLSKIVEGYQSCKETGNKFYS